MGTYVEHPTGSCLQLAQATPGTEQLSRHPRILSNPSILISTLSSLPSTHARGLAHFSK